MAFKDHWILFIFTFVQRTEGFEAVCPLKPVILRTITANISVMSHIGELQMSIEYSVGILFFKTIIIFYPLKWTVQCSWKPMKRKFVLSL